MPSSDQPAVLLRDADLSHGASGKIDVQDAVVGAGYLG